MAVTSLDATIAGFQPGETIIKVGSTLEAAGVMQSFAYASGRPGAMVVPTPGLNGAALTSYAGQIPFTNPVSGNKYLGRFTYRANQAGSVLLCDRLWHNSGIVSATTTAQAITFPGLPARDRDGTTDGVDVLVGIEVSTATTNGAPITNTTLSYTNSAEDPGQVATIASFPATATANTFVPFQLAASDNGVRSVESVTLGTSYGTGVIHLVAYRVIAELGLPLAGAAVDLDFVKLGMPRLYNNTVPFLIWVASSTSSPTTGGQLVYIEG